MFKVGICFLAAIVVVNAIVCRKDYCKSVCCEEVECTEDQIYVERGTYCGCCPACLTKLKEGESCASQLLRGVPPKTKCDEGLECDSETRTCEYPDCGY